MTDGGEREEGRGEEGRGGEGSLEKIPTHLEHIAPALRINPDGQQLSTCILVHSVAARRCMRRGRMLDLFAER